MASFVYQPDDTIPKRGRKKIKRHINFTPPLTIRQPIDGVKDPAVITIGHDELETIRLKQINNLGIVSGAKQMGISKSLFAKIYNEAIKKITNALVYGKSLQIELAPNVDDNN